MLAAESNESSHLTFKIYNLKLKIDNSSRKVVSKVPAILPA